MAKKVKGGSLRARAIIWDNRLREQCEERQIGHEASEKGNGE